MRLTRSNPKSQVSSRGKELLKPQLPSFSNVRVVCEEVFVSSTPSRTGSSHLIAQSSVVEQTCRRFSADAHRALQPWPLLRYGDGS